MLTLIVVAIIIVVWALVEVIQADAAQIRRLPKWAWMILVIVPAPPAGAIAWFIFGRPKAGSDAPRAAGGGLSIPGRTRYVARPAPDDDPDFLRRLNDESEQRKMLRRFEDDLNSPNDD